MSTTERRLKITPGEAIVETHAQGDYYGNITVKKAPGIIQTISCQLKYAPVEEQVANAALYADAHNTANACDMLPSELLADRKELLSLVQVLVDALGHRLDGTREDCSDNMASFKEPQLGINHGWQALSLAKSKYGITPTTK